MSIPGLQLLDVDVTLMRTRDKQLGTWMGNDDIWIIFHVWIAFLLMIVQLTRLLMIPTVMYNINTERAGMKGGTT